MLAGHFLLYLVTDMSTSLIIVVMSSDVKIKIHTYSEETVANIAKM